MRLSRSIIFTVPLLSSFVASVGNPVTEDVGRTFYMDGPSALACAAVGFFMCPVGFHKKPDGVKIACNSFQYDMSDILCPATS